MPKLMLLVLLALSLPVQANDWFDSQKPVTCGPFRDLVQALTRDKYKEYPLWIGQSSQDATQFSLFTNIDTGAWTLVQYGKSTGCVMGVGETSNIVNLVPFREKQ